MEMDWIDGSIRSSVKIPEFDLKAPEFSKEHLKKAEEHISRKSCAYNHKEEDNSIKLVPIDKYIFVGTWLSSN